MIERKPEHGPQRPNPRNIRLTAERVALIDWDEAHVDVYARTSPIGRNFSEDIREIVGTLPYSRK